MVEVKKQVNFAISFASRGKSLGGFMPALLGSLLCDLSPLVRRELCRSC